MFTIMLPICQLKMAFNWRKIHTHSLLHTDMNLSIQIPYTCVYVMKFWVAQNKVQLSGESYLFEIIRNCGQMLWFINKLAENKNCL